MRFGSVRTGLRLVVLVRFLAEWPDSRVSLTAGSGSRNAIR